jgi:hypothetical protein
MIPRPPWAPPSLPCLRGRGYAGRDTRRRRAPSPACGEEVTREEIRAAVEPPPLLAGEGSGVGARGTQRGGGAITQPPDDEVVGL